MNPKKFLDNPELIAQYARALLILQQIGFIEEMQKAGRPQIIGGGSDVQVMATQAAQSAGYYQCLSDLVDFEKKYILTNIPNQKVNPDWGGSELSVSLGYMTQKEADELNS